MKITLRTCFEKAWIHLYMAKLCLQSALLRLEKVKWAKKKLQSRQFIYKLSVKAQKNDENGHKPPKRVFFLDTFAIEHAKGCWNPCVGAWSVSQISAFNRAHKRQLSRGLSGRRQWRTKSPLGSSGRSTSEVPRRTSMYLEVPQHTQKYLKEVPKKTKKNIKVPKSTSKYLEVPQST